MQWYWYLMDQDGVLREKGESFPSFQEAREFGEKKWKEESTFFIEGSMVLLNEDEAETIITNGGLLNWPRDRVTIERSLFELGTTRREDGELIVLDE